MPRLNTQAESCAGLRAHNGDCMEPGRRLAVRRVAQPATQALGRRRGHLPPQLEGGITLVTVGRDREPAQCRGRAPAVFWQPLCMSLMAIVVTARARHGFDGTLTPARSKYRRHRRRPLPVTHAAMYGIAAGTACQCRAGECRVIARRLRTWRWTAPAGCWPAAAPIAASVSGTPNAATARTSLKATRAATDLRGA